MNEWGYTFWQSVVLGAIAGLGAGFLAGAALGWKAAKDIWKEPAEHWRDEFWRSTFGKPYEGE